LYDPDADLWRIWWSSTTNPGRLDPPVEGRFRDGRGVFLGEDETRPMGERVRRFLNTYGGETYYVDSADLELPGIPADQRGYVAPLVYAALVARLAAHYAAVRGYALEGRRYMWKVDY